MGRGRPGPCRPTGRASEGPGGPGDGRTCVGSEGHPSGRPSIRASSLCTKSFGNPPQPPPPRVDQGPVTVRAKQWATPACRAFKQWVNALLILFSGQPEELGSEKVGALWWGFG